MTKLTFILVIFFAICIGVRIVIHSDPNALGANSDDIGFIEIVTTEKQKKSDLSGEPFDRQVLSVLPETHIQNDPHEHYNPALQEIPVAVELFKHKELTYEDMRLLLNDLTFRELLEIFVSSSHITEELIFSTYHNPEEKLREIAAIWYSEPIDGTPQENKRDALVFTSTSIAGRDALVVREEFSQFDRQIYAVIKLPDDYRESFYLVRWINIEDRSIWFLDRHMIEGTPQQLQEIWMRKSAGWQKGRYQVEVYSAKDLMPLSSASYEVIIKGNF